MIRASLVMSALATFVLLVMPSRADDGPEKPEAVRKTPGGPKKTSDGKPTAAVAPEPFPGLLRDALKAIHALAEQAVKDETKLTMTMPGPDMFTMRFSKELQADVVRAIGVAQARLGDLPTARSTWQSAIDVTAEISSFDPGTDRAPLYVQIAESQVEAGERDEARFTVRQAIQAIRSIRSESPFRLPDPTGMDFAYDHVAQKAVLLERIARAQAQMGDPAASESTAQQAVQTAESIGKPRNKIRALLEIVRNRPAPAAEPLWKRALDLALEMKKDHSRAEAVEVVLRARIKADQFDEALSAISGRLTGDLQAYALWAFADAVASSDHAVRPQTLERLSQLALKAQFDRPSKKIKLFQGIAEAHARVGDYDGAYRAAGEPHPVNDIQNARATQARIKVMTAVAAAQINAKQFDAAKGTVEAALEYLTPLPNEDAEAYFPLARLGELQAEAGDRAGALLTADALSLAWSKVSILAKVAVAESRAGRGEEARNAIRRGLDAAKLGPSDSLWRETSHSDDFGPELDPMLPLLQMLAQAQAQIGDLEGALKTIGQMSTPGLGHLSRYQTVDQIVSARLETDDVDGALRAIALIPLSDVMFQDEKADLLERVARRSAERGAPAAILEWAGKQPTPRAKLQLFRGLADGIAARYAAKPKNSTREAKPADTPAHAPSGAR